MNLHARSLLPKGKAPWRRTVASAVLVLAVLVATIGAIPLARPQTAVADPVFSYFPSASATDGRMLAIAGDGLSTLSGSTVTLSFSVANSASSFLVGFFDGDDRSVWDANQTTAFPTRYELYADPLGNGSGSTLVATWTEADMTQNSWKDFAVNTSSAAQTPAGNYSYRLTVSGTTSNATYNNFKVRVEGLTYITPTSVFGYMGAKASGITTDGAYDGDWEFNMIVPNGASHFGLWDGDFDYGASSSAGDTDDPNTSSTPPTWSPDSALAESAKGVGVPPDDNTDATLRRSPSVMYEIILPNGQTYQNLNPSGTTEWEYFRLDTAAFNSAVMDYHVDSLPPGVYTVRVHGVDWRNLNAFRFEFPILSQDASGAPVVPPAPFLVGDRVWDDTTTDGVQGPGEPGLAGVKVLLRDAVSGSIVNSATTDASGAYQLNSWNGSYIVELDASNFVSGGVLDGFEATTPQARAVTITDNNRLDTDFGLHRPLLTIAPSNRYGLACPGGSIEHTFTVRNWAGSAGLVSLAVEPGLGWPSQIRNAAGASITSVALASGESTTVSVWLSVPLGSTIGSRDVSRLTASMAGVSPASAVVETLVRPAVEVAPDQSGNSGVGSTVDYTHTVTNSSPTTQTVTLSASDSNGWSVSLTAADGTTPMSSVVLGPNGGSATLIAHVSVPAGTAKGTTSTTTVRATMGSNTDTAIDTTMVQALETYASNTYTVAKNRFLVGEDVFARCTGLSTSRHNYVWKNPSGTTVRTQSNTRPTSGVLTDSYHIADTDPTGTWTVEVYRSGNLIETQTFVVGYNASITALYGTNAATLGSLSTIGSTVQNSGTSTLADGHIDYVIWWDSDGDAVFDAGDTGINSAGSPVAYSASLVTHATNATVAPAQQFTDPGWAIANSAFPNRGTYQVTATLVSAAGGVIDTKTSSFFSVPTLGEGTVPTLKRRGSGTILPIVLLGLVIWPFVLVKLWRRRSWLLFYGLGALGTVLFTLTIAQALGLDSRLASIEAMQVAWMARVLDMRIEHVSASGLAIRNHIGWGVFDIGIECSALLELASFVGLALFYPTFRASRKAGIVAIGLTATYVINLLRILLIVGMIATLGTGWVFFAHAVVGRVFFFVGVVAIFWFLMTRPTVGVVRDQLQEARHA